MIDIRIVCTYDAVKLAETLMRLLEAEGHRVRLTYGRQALAALEEARDAHEAVLLIWSQDARSQIYMIEWARGIAPSRLVEIARTGDCPAIAQRKAPVIDFAPWRGERGARAWNALNDRLRAVARVLNPPKPPSRNAVLALGLASAAAVVGAVVVRVNTDAGAPQMAQAPTESLAVADPGTGVGGPLRSLEPASFGDEFVDPRGVRDMPLIDAGPEPALADLPDVVEIELRDATMLERINALNPLRQRDDTSE